MENNNLYSLRDLLTSGVMTNGEKKVVSRIVIPKIQRSYAQGRDEETQVREQILTAIFDAIKSEDGDEKLELGFIYGSLEYRNDGKFDFVLLDGQQRITTLFLVHLYIQLREQGSVQKWLIDKFTYETRKTSGDFIKELGLLKYSEGDHSFISWAAKERSESKSEDDVEQRFSSWAKDSIWYTNAFEEDSTVQAMLTMLDAIQKHYDDAIPNKNGTDLKQKDTVQEQDDSVQEQNDAVQEHDDAIQNQDDAVKEQNDNIWLSDKLERLKFYVLPLKDFGLTEELYIKMNARGLPLTPFECFKADLLGEYKLPEVSDKFKNIDLLDFASKIDNKWIDLFWKASDNSDKEYNDRFFRFFYRLCSTLVYLEYNTGVKQNDEIQKFFDETSETQSNDDVRYLGFEFYHELICKGVIDLMAYTMKILDTWCENRKIIEGQLNAPWGDRTELFEKDSYRRKDAVRFSAITQYILSHKDFRESNFKKWMRVVWNTVENYDIDNFDAQKRAAQQLRGIAKEDASNNDIYKTLSDWKGDLILPLREEQKKASIIIHSAENSPEHKNNDGNWEDLFKKIEQHEFFRGFVDVILPKDSDWETIANDEGYDKINNRITIISELFDQKGIKEDYREDHILLRAILACIDKWNDGLNWLRITENVNDDAHLKKLLRREDVKERLQRDVLDKTSNVSGLITLLENVIKKPVQFDYNTCGNIHQSRIDLARKRLLTDIRLHNWIADHCTSKSILIRERDSRIKVRVPAAWYAKLYLDNNLNEEVHKFIESNTGFEYANQDQKKSRDDYGYYFDDSVTIKKDGVCKVSITFSHTEEVKIELYTEDSSIQTALTSTSLVEFSEGKAEIKTDVSEFKDKFTQVSNVISA